MIKKYQKLEEKNLELVEIFVVRNIINQNISFDIFN